MLHVTLNTGHSRVSPRSEVGDDAIAMVRPLLERGGQLPGPFADYAVDVEAGECLRSSVRKGAGRPIVICGVAAEDGPAADLEWAFLSQASGVPATKPPAAPWLGVALMRGMMEEASEAAEWLGDFERCVAWAWLESR